MRKLLVLMLAVTYLGAVYCRAACAMAETASPSGIAAFHGKNECNSCHHEKSKSPPPGHRSNSCCLSHFDGAIASLSSEKIIRSPNSLSQFPVITLATVVSTLPQVMRNDLPLKLVIPKALARVSSNPRAPPSSVL